MAKRKREGKASSEGNVNMGHEAGVHGSSQDRINMNHGAGGEGMQALLRDIILGPLASDRAEIGLDQLDDSGVIEGVVLTTDGHTVKPLFYPGGDIGRLAVCGTVNDVAAMGAEVLALSLGMIIEDGLEMDALRRVIASVAATSRECEVPVITGDTKVVERGAIEKLMLTTSGIGRMWEPLERNNLALRESTGREQRWLRDANVRPGDDIIITGTIGDHGIALMSFREGYNFRTTLESDNAPLNGLMREALLAGGLAAAKDPTRGGVANALNEWSSKSKVGIVVEEGTLPFDPQVRAASDMLGIDPLEVGNEGKYLIATAPDFTDDVLKTVRKNRYGRKAAVIARADAAVKRVVVKTAVGGTRILEPPAGDPVPRIC